MKEYEFQNIMNEIAYRIYDSAYINLKLAQDFWMCAHKSENDHDWEANIRAAKEFYSRAVEDITIISELTGEGFDKLYDKAPYPFSEKEITRWWE